MNRDTGETFDIRNYDFDTVVTQSGQRIKFISPRDLPPSAAALSPSLSLLHPSSPPPPQLGGTAAAAGECLYMLRVILKCACTVCMYWFCFLIRFVYLYYCISISIGIRFIKNIIWHSIVYVLMFNSQYSVFNYILFCFVFSGMMGSPIMSLSHSTAGNNNKFENFGSGVHKPVDTNLANIAFASGSSNNNNMGSSTIGSNIPFVPFPSAATYPHHHLPPGANNMNNNNIMNRNTNVYPPAPPASTGVFPPQPSSAMNNFTATAATISPVHTNSTGTGTQGFSPSTSNNNLSVSFMSTNNNINNNTNTPMKPNANSFTNLAMSTSSSHHHSMSPGTSALAPGTTALGASGAVGRDVKVTSAAVAKKDPFSDLLGNMK